MTTKAYRIIDAQGRIIIPNHIRQTLNLQTGNHVEVELLEDGAIRIKPADERCTVCGDNLEPGAKTYTMSGRKVCGFCAHGIANQIRKEKEE